MKQINYESKSGWTEVMALEVEGLGCIVRFINRQPGKGRVDSCSAVWVPGVTVRDGVLVAMSTAIRRTKTKKKR